MLNVHSAPMRIDGTDDIVLVASGKGGVGKSTVAVNLACALQQMGLTVGLLDADIYGPSIARMLASGEGLVTNTEGRAIPAFSNCVHSVSIANLLPPESALAWKGPLAAQALMQMFRDVAWPELDVLLVDLPPGTGDVQLTILEQIPVTGALVVTTPQRLSALDAERAVALFHEHDIPVFGIVENMAGYVCPCCGERQNLYSGSGALDIAEKMHVANLGQIPLDPGAQSDADRGSPIVAAHCDTPTVAAFQQLARQVQQALTREKAADARRLDRNVAAESEAFWEHMIDE